MKEVHIYVPERSIKLGSRYYIEKNEPCKETLYQTISGQYFLFGEGGYYTHTEGTLFTRKTVNHMIIPLCKKAAAGWLLLHKSQTLVDATPAKELLHLSVSAKAKDQLIALASENKTTMSRMVELLIERGYHA